MGRGVRSAVVVAVLGAMSLVLAPAAPAWDGLISNGGFAAPEIPEGHVTYAAAAQPAGFDWTVGGEGIDHVNGGWQAALDDGNGEWNDSTNSVDLNACGPGSIEQVFQTTPGHQYAVTFWLAGNPGGGETIKNLSVSWNGSVIAQPSFDTTGHTTTSMGWTYVEYSVTATNATSTLSFASQEAGCFGPALDEIWLNFIPPTTPRCVHDFQDHAAVAYVGRDKVTIGRDAAGRIRMDGVVCETATLANVEVVGVAVIEGDSFNVALNLANGPFTKPNGTWLALDMPGFGPADRLEVRGSAGRDVFGVGDQGITFDGGTDPELVFMGLDIETLIFRGADSGDTLRAYGGGNLGATFPRRVQLFGDAGNDSLTGGAGNDRLTGGTGADTLGGRSGKDTLLGESENDTLAGGPGADTLDGGTHGINPPGDTCDPGTGPGDTVANCET